MSSPNQMEKMAAAVGNKARPAPALAPKDDLPPEYWQALQQDACLETELPGYSIAALPLTDISWHLLRIACRRCGRTVEIQKIDAIRLYGERAVWKDVGQRLLDDTCQARTGRYEEDGCWPSFETR
jgi:hypothetical protein